MPFRTVKYVPPKQKDYIRQLPVYRIMAVGHAKKPDGKGGHTNHWCFYLQVGEVHSVRIDMTPSYSELATELARGSKGIMIVSLLDYPYSQSALKVETIELDNPGVLVVANVVDALTESGFDNYEFDSNGVGCRCWTTGVLELLKHKGWGNVDAIEQAKS